MLHVPVFGQNKREESEKYRLRDAHTYITYIHTFSFVPSISKVCLQQRVDLSVFCVRRRKRHRSSIIACTVLHKVVFLLYAMWISVHVCMYVCIFDQMFFVVFSVLTLCKNSVMSILNTFFVPYLWTETFIFCIRSLSHAWKKKHVNRNTYTYLRRCTKRTSNSLFTRHLILRTVLHTFIVKPIAGYTSDRDQE